MSYTSNRSHLFTPNYSLFLTHLFLYFKFLCFMYFIVIWKNNIVLEGLYIVKEKNVYMWNQYYYFDLPKNYFKKVVFVNSIITLLLKSSFKISAVCFTFLRNLFSYTFNDIHIRNLSLKKQRLLKYSRSFVPYIPLFSVFTVRSREGYITDGIRITNTCKYFFVGDCLSFIGTELCFNFKGITS